MSRQMGAGTGGLYVVNVPRPPTPPPKRKRDLPTTWNGRLLEPHEREIIADGFDRDHAITSEIVRGVTT